jgi:hypothetical protein
MGHLVRQQSHIVILLISLWLTGCAAVSAVAIIPGTLLEAVANQFVGEEESFPVSMQTSLAATQLGLRSMNLDVDILEIQKEGGYAVAFGNDKLNGSIRLKKQTERLTTIYVKVRRTTREESVERAVVETIRAKIKSMPRNNHFQKAGYHNLRKKPTVKSVRLGWFHLGAHMDVYKSGTSGWLKIKLPSGKIAYLKGSIKGKIARKVKR